MQREYWPLVALWTAPRVDPSGTAKRLTSMQLQKTLFVLGQLRSHTVGDNFYQFVPYHYGPFSKAIEDDLRRLEEQQLVQSVESSREWEITQGGTQLAATLSESEDTETVAYLGRLTQWARRVTRAVLLSAIYERFPEYARHGDAIADE